MKNKFFAIAIIAFGFTASANAQNSASATATASASVVTPISINKEGDMNFGSIVQSALGGTVVLAPSGSVTTTGVTMFNGSTAAATAPAEFTIAGEPDFAYQITLPDDNTVTLGDGNGHTMDLTGFTHNAIGTFGSSPETFQVGATLNVGALQAAGNYVSTAFTVTIAYN